MKYCYASAQLSYFKPYRTFFGHVDGTGGAAAFAKASGIFVGRHFVLFIEFIYCYLDVFMSYALILMT